MLTDVFRLLDENGDGVIGFDEAFEFVHGRSAPPLIGREPAEACHVLGCEFFPCLLPRALSASAACVPRFCKLRLPSLPPRNTPLPLPRHPHLPNSSMMYSVPSADTRSTREASGSST